METEAPFEQRSVTVEQGRRQSRLQVRLHGTAGSGMTFVLESGGGGMTAEQWATIEQQLAGHGLVMSYDRAGIGKSQAASSLSPAAVADRLLAVLTAVGIETPYVLIGYSLGCLYARYFAATRPGKILGLVLLDPTPLDDAAYERSRFDLPTPVVILIVHVWAWALYFFAQSGLAALLYRTVWRARDGSLAKLVRRGGELPKSRHVRTLLRELRSMGSIQKAAAGQALPVALPVLYISAGLPPKLEGLRKHHRKLAESGPPPWSRHQIVDGATHASLVIDPQHARIVGDLIVEFAGQVAARIPA